MLQNNFSIKYQAKHDDIFNFGSFKKNTTCCVRINTNYSNIFVYSDGESQKLLHSQRDM